MPLLDTGAFVTSWAVSPKRRSRTSHGKPRRQDPTAKRQESIGQMREDIQALDLLEIIKVWFKNGAPHSQYVNMSSAVQAKIRDRFG